MKLFLSNSIGKLPKRQKGVVLFVALIVLVAMTLAGIGLMRSVDTTNLVAGNLAFKQASIQGGDQAIEAAFTWLDANKGTAYLNDDHTADGYFSSQQTEPSDWTKSTVWANAKCLNAGCAEDPTTKNKVSYIIHRMCTWAGTAYNGTNGAGVPNQCATNQSTSSSSSDGTSHRSDIDDYGGDLSLYYRVSARIEGPHNTFTVIQAMVQLPAS
jgi:type IV pilus assembly protein PilX